MKIFKKDLVLTKDTEFKESIKVEGDIKGYFNLKVLGDIDARDIDAWNIDAKDIYAKDINARMIIFCEKRTKKSKTATTKSRVFIENRSKLEIKEWKK